MKSKRISNFALFITTVELENDNDKRTERERNSLTYNY